MKRTLLLCAFASSLRLCVNAESLNREKLADAIYRAEGGPRAKVPYGILSVRVTNAAEARVVCLRTIDHAWRDWLVARQTSPVTFINFLGDRYCPPADDAVGNRHWKHNVNWIYAHRQN